MAIKRFSAISNFGVPIDNMETLGRFAHGAEYIEHLLGSYGIEGEEVPVDTLDITPYYWKQPAFRYMMTRNSAVAPVEVEMLPTANDSEAYVPIGSFVVTGVRKVVIPTDQEVMIIAGPGPRFPDQICIHEVVIGDS